MKVLMVEHFSPGNAYTEELIQFLSSYDTLTVMCKENANEFQSNIIQRRNMYGGECPNKLIAFVKYLIGICALAKEVFSKKYRVIHVQTFKNARIESYIYRSRRKGTRLVHTVHNILPHEVKNGDRELYKNFYDMCDALLVHNEECKRQLIENFQIEREKIYVIPHGAYSVLPPEDVEKNVQKTHYLMFGTIRQYKGVDILLKAISMIPASERAQMEFLIAGRQYKKQNSLDYEALAKEFGITDCVRILTRRIDDEELPKLFGWADICLFPYRQIYGSGALLMAYSYRKPVIASDVPVFIEETNEESTGLLFKNQDSADLAKAIRRSSTWTSEQYKTYRNTIQELIETRFNWKCSAQMTHQVYEYVCAKKAFNLNCP